jgi:secreted PhoX family phosphatase
MEDGPATPDSQLWMYVGAKSTRDGATALQRNGLVDGKLYFFRSNNPSKTSEKTFQSGTVQGNWFEVPNARSKTDQELEAFADANGAFTFIRPEDGAFNPSNPRLFHFVTTGGTKDEGNELGRLYTLRFNSKGTVGPASLHIEYNADTIVGHGGDIAISPDNMDASDDYLMIQEDGTTPSRAVMDAKDRDGSIWRFGYTPEDDEGAPAWTETIDVGSAARVVELDPPGRDGNDVGPGVWETSGIIDTEGFFGQNTWTFDVQAHSPTTAPAPNTVEDGQLLIIRPAG